MPRAPGSEGRDRSSSLPPPAGPGLCQQTGGPEACVRGAEEQGWLLRGQSWPGFPAPRPAQLAPLPGAPLRLLGPTGRARHRGYPSARLSAGTVFCVRMRPGVSLVGVGGRGLSSGDPPLLPGDGRLLRQRHPPWGPWGRLPGRVPREGEAPGSGSHTAWSVCPSQGAHDSNLWAGGRAGGAGPPVAPPTVQQP